MQSPGSVHTFVFDRFFAALAFEPSARETKG